MAKKAPASTAKSTAAKGTALEVGERAKPATPPSAPSRHLDVFPNPAPQRDYVIQFQVPEFTCFCHSPVSPTSLTSPSTASPTSFASSSRA